MGFIYRCLLLMRVKGMLARDEYWMEARVAIKHLRGFMSDDDHLQVHERLCVVWGIPGFA